MIVPLYPAVMEFVSMVLTYTHVIASWDIQAVIVRQVNLLNVVGDTIFISKGV